jgi:hypothetical protein
MLLASWSFTNKTPCSFLDLLLHAVGQTIDNTQLSLRSRLAQSATGPWISRVREKITRTHSEQMRNTSTDLPIYDAYETRSKEPALLLIHFWETAGYLLLQRACAVQPSALVTSTASSARRRPPLRVPVPPAAHRLYGTNPLPRAVPNFLGAQCEIYMEAHSHTNIYSYKNTIKYLTYKNYYALF